MTGIGFVLLAALAVALWLAAVVILTLATINRRLTRQNAALRAELDQWPIFAAELVTLDDSALVEEVPSRLARLN